MESEFPGRLRKLRERRGISQRVLSERCGMSKNMISVYESGEVEPTVSVIREIAKCLDVSSDYLIGLKENF